MITLDRVSKSYGRGRVVDSVSVSIPAGGLTCFVGPNGAGKSTLLSMIARLLPPDEGTIHLDDLDVCTPSSHASPRSIVAKPSTREARPARRDLTSVPQSTRPASIVSSM